MENEKKNNITEMVFIIDRSGSMYELEKDTIGGFNSMIKEQKEKEGKCYVSTMLFNDYSKIIHDRLDIMEVPEMTSKDYRADGSTALIDAIGDAINHIMNIHKYARPEDVPTSTIFVITTDGMENCSHRYSSRLVKDMIKCQKKSYGWEFIFIGANIDAVETAREIGIDESRSVNYHSDRLGTKTVYRSVSSMMRDVRSCGTVDDEWRKDIDEDFNNRK